MKSQVAEKAMVPLYLLTSACILLLMVVSFSDVIMRSLGRPIPGAFEITEVGVGAMVFAALPLVTLRREHITVGLFSSLVGRHPWLRLLFTIASRVVSVLVFGFLAWHIWALGNQMSATGAEAVFAGLPLAPFAWFASAMCVLSAVATLLTNPVAPAREGQGEF